MLLRATHTVKTICHVGVLVCSCTRHTVNSEFHMSVFVCRKSYKRQNAGTTGYCFHQGCP